MLSLLIIEMKRYIVWNSSTLTRKVSSQCSKIEKNCMYKPTCWGKFELDMFMVKECYRNFLYSSVPRPPFATRKHKMNTRNKNARVEAQISGLSEFFPVLPIGRTKLQGVVNVKNAYIDSQASSISKVQREQILIYQYLLHNIYLIA